MWQATLGVCSIQVAVQTTRARLIRFDIEPGRYRHCSMKCHQILREKTSSQKSTVIALRIQWKLSAEGKCL
jgi:hypothetical protein